MKTIIKTISIFLITIFTMTGCYNDDLVWQELDKHEQMILELQSVCDRINSEIETLKQIAEALDERDYLVKVKKTDEQVVLTFAEAGKVTINLPQEDEDSSGNDDSTDIPMIGIRQDTDGNWYWTSDGEWITDQNGNKIPAQGEGGDEGQGGEDGVTPLVKIENGYWMVSYDQGQTWEVLGNAGGEAGKEGDSFFKDVIVTESLVTLVLADGTTVDIPKGNNEENLVDIIFSDMGVGMTPGATRQVSFTLTNADENTLVKAVAQNGWKVKVTMTSVSEGYLTVTAPDPMEEDEVIVFVYDGNGKTVMKTINFVTGVVSVTMETRSISGRASDFTIELETNLDVEIEIPSEAGSWMTCHTAPTKAMNNVTCTISVTDNFSESIRTATLLVKDRNSSWNTEINITQAIHDYLDFPDPNFSSYLIENFDANNDGEINRNEVGAIKEIRAENKDISSLEGISSLSFLEVLDVSGNTLSELDLSSDNLWRLKTLDCSDNDIIKLDISGCRFYLEDLDITGNPRMTFTQLDGQGTVEAKMGPISEITYIPDTYQSADYSQHETVVTLQEHSVGNGIPVVFMGDGYTDRDVETGFYDFRMRQAMEYMFSEEPYITFRDRFDVYYVTLISKSRIFDGTTALESNLNGLVVLNATKAKSYATRATLKTSFPCAIINSSEGRSMVFNKVANCSESNVKIGDKSDFRNILIHELNGHLIGKLGDEYVEYVNESYPFDTISSQNLSISNDPLLVPWANFLNIPEYSELVGIFEGGDLYSSGVWRSSENSVMRNSGLTTKFNAVCRHIIYKRIHELAGEEYSWEAFLEYDKKNLADSPR